MTIDPVGTTWGTPIGIGIVLVCFVLLILIFIPAYLGIRLGAAFATVLGVLFIPVCFVVVRRLFARRRVDAPAQLAVQEGH